MSERDATLDDFTGSSEDADSQEAGEKELFGLGEIPPEWVINPLSDTTEIIPGNSPPSSTYNKNEEGLPFFQGNSEFGHFHPEADTWCSEPRKEAEKNDVLMSIRAPVGDLNIADRDCCIGRGLAALRPQSINGLYLFYNLAERKPWLSRLATGSTFKSVTKGDLQLFEVPIPSLEEQRKIASVLYNVDQAIQKTEELINQSERVKLGLAQDLLSDGINDEAKVETNSRFGSIPDSWELHPLKQIGEIAGRTAPEKDESECWGGDIPWATPSEITSLEGPTISKTEEHLTEVALEKVSSNLLPPESVLLTTRATIGECAVNTVEMTTNQGFKNLIPGDRLDTWYAYYRLEYEGDYLASLSKGSTFPEVGKDTVGNFVIPVPPLEEQKEIAERLKSVDDMILSYKSNKSQLQRLKEGLMKDLLSGTVRTTDTNIQVLDEVAQHG